jgi:hypothetical protein
MLGNIRSGAILVGMPAIAELGLCLRHAQRPKASCRIL